jgi:hypothetical protein
MNRLLISAVLALCFAVAACAPSSTLFQPSNSAMQAANPVLLTVGQRSEVDGMDVWRDGGPDRKYREIGRIEDYGDSSVFARNRRMADVVELAIAQGDDASGCAPNRIGGANCTEKRVFVVIAYNE